MKKMLVVAIFTITFIVPMNISGSAGQTLQPGDIVFAEWSSNGWYHGTVGDACGGGKYMVLFDDGDKKCCSINQIVIDAVPPADSVSEGTPVLAQWSDGKFYPGKVISIDGEVYNISFDDGDQGQAGLEQIRLRE